MAAVLVVGSGIAGLSLALEASDLGHQVTVVTKGGLGQSNTRFAQGGIAAAVFDEDSVESHIADTLAAGAGLCDAEAVRVLCAEGPTRIKEMIDLGVAFDTKNGELAHGLEAAHSYPRVLHAGGDATGAVIEAALVARLRERHIDIHEHAFLLELTTTVAGAVSGAQVELADGRRRHFTADVVVLGTGGAGQLYPYTSNPLGATGDGAACAARIGAKLADVEFYQFHPTTLARPGNFLVSEAVRGEGAVLRDADGERFMADTPGQELAPRDVVARAVAIQMAAQGGTPVVLDATAMGADFLATRFPSIDAGVREAGLDWAADPIPITPAAHYWMGGIATDLWGRTSVRGLFAIGECSRTGVHGANRLASNSLLEGSVFGHRAAQVLDDLEDWPADDHIAGFTFVDLPATGAETGPTRPFSRAALQQLMWDAVGLMRTGEQLQQALDTLGSWDLATADPTDRSSYEDLNLLLLAHMCATAALARTESIGAHFRLDAPDSADEAANAAMVSA
ncbi:MAG: L-aspartate oxidase [Beutenbergiaceae bacterium]